MSDLSKQFISSIPITHMSRLQWIQFKNAIERLHGLEEENGELKEQVRVLREALQSLVDHGKPLRGDGELWSNWQPRVKEWEEARASLAQTEPTPTP